MSTEGGSGTPPRTRAEVRALRAAQEAQDAAAAQSAPKDAAPEASPETPEVTEPAASASSVRPIPPVPVPSGPITMLPPVDAVDAPGPRRRSGYIPPDPDTAYTYEAPAEREPRKPRAPREPRAVREPREPRTSREPRAPRVPREPRPAGTGFGRMLLAVLVVLAVMGTGLGVLSLTQGPRLSGVQVDPVEATSVSGSRVILTANQPLAEVDPAQVTVDPAVPFTIDAAGRSVGIRFTVPLHDDTEYTVTVADVIGTGGGAVGELRTSFTTPASEVHLLRRDADEEGRDSIFRTDLSGERAVPVFTHDRIADFRATTTALVVSVEEDGASRLLVMGRNGDNPRELDLPGDGYVTGIQVSERGGLVGYTYSDATISDDVGRASVLVTQSLSGGDEPRIVEVEGQEASIVEWRFVPDSTALLFIDFDSALALDDPVSDAGVQSLGLAMTIQGVTRGTYTAIVERTDGQIVQLDLADGSESPLPASEPDHGPATTITPFPGGTLRHVVDRDESGLPVGQGVIVVDDEGAATPVAQVSGNDAILQTCVSPSGQYAAIVVAPDLATNTYDDLLAPLPTTLHTHLFDLGTGEEMVRLAGFDISWCAVPPAF